MQIATFIPEKRKAWREWQDEILVLHMRDELTLRATDLADAAAVRTSLLAANFSDRNIDRLGAQATAAAEKVAA